MKTLAKLTPKLEARLRRKAGRQGLIMRKCRARDPRQSAFDTYGLTDTNNHVVLSDGSTAYGVSLEAVANYLTENTAVITPSHE